MAVRVYMAGDPPRVITSKPGHNASPELEYIYKTFDSDWLNGAGIRWIFQGSVQGPRDVTRTVMFPYVLDHIPRFDFFWGGYYPSFAGPIGMRGVTWPVAFPSNTPMFSGWGGSADIVGDVENVRCYTDRCFVQRRVGGSAQYRYTIIVYQS